MGGAFVGVADDGTAIYWNPAGLAAGSYFSLALDHGVGEPTQQGTRGGDSKNTIIGVSMPALGLGYYRLEARSVVPSVLLLPVDEVPSSRNLSAVEPVRVNSLVTHHTGVTLVQSLMQGVAIGSTLKVVSGKAASTLIDAASVEAALDRDVDEAVWRVQDRVRFRRGLHGVRRRAEGGPDRPKCPGAWISAAGRRERN